MAANSRTSSSSASDPARPTNRLAQERSPYLLEHAHDPVDWYPWGQEAFERARVEDKLIFLSSGYASCRWCHVLQVESFSDPEVAALMNRLFVSIKIDRDEHPEVDRIYMTYLQATQGGGGWPLSVWLTPDLHPVFAGTYFPKVSRYGQPSFTTICQSVSRAWTTQRPRLLQQGKAVIGAIADALSSGGQADADDAAAAADERAMQRDTPSADAIKDAHAVRTLIAAYVRSLRDSYDEEFGGWGNAPKFPRPVVFQLLLAAAHKASGIHPAEVRTTALDMCVHTLKKIARAGLFDFVGSGFHRYGVSRDWHVWHAEKMANDNAQLARVYVDAFALTGDEALARTARAVYRYVERDLLSPSPQHSFADLIAVGEDAESYPTHTATVKAEGGFYTWLYEDVVETLRAGGQTNEQIKRFCEFFDIHKGGNVFGREKDPHGEFAGKNILRRAPNTYRSNMDVDEQDEALRQGLELLRVARERDRPRPLLDYKCLANWNGMMIGAWARGSVVLNEAALLTRAERCIASLKANYWDASTRTFYRLRYVDQPNGTQASCSDYANVIAGVLDFVEAAPSHPRVTEFLQWARALQQRQDELFRADDGGYFASVARADLVMRLRDSEDGADPSDNSVSALNLLRFAALLHEQSDATRYRTLAEQTLRTNASAVQRMPAALPLMQLAFLALHTPTREVTVTLPPSVSASDQQAFVFLREAALAAPPIPAAQLVRFEHAQAICMASGSAAAANNGTDNRTSTSAPHPSLVAAASPAASAATLPVANARVCDELHGCSLPTTDPAQLRATLQSWFQ